jgi:hypothetical protein
MLWRVLLFAALGGALVDEHDQRGGHDEDSVVIEGELNKEKCELYKTSNTQGTLVEPFNTICTTKFKNSAF